MSISSLLRISAQPFLIQLRYASDKAARVIVQKNTDGTAILTLNNPPVNILDMDTMSAYVKEIKALDADESCRGVIITSASERAFSAGLDINVFCSGDRDRLNSYWRNLQDLWYYTYQSRLATVAAINGAAIAGGCVLAICCGVRIMANTGPKSLIGLNETKLGLTMPFWINDRLIQIVGHHKAENAVLRGLLLDASEALKFGYVDRIVGSTGELMDAANQELRQILEIPAHARAQTKRSMRQPILEKFLSRRDRDVEELTDAVCDPRTQKILHEYLATLTKRKGK